MNNSKKVNGKSSRRVYSRSDKAITLIALIVTIIVLLILAGISISILAGDNNILSKTGQAVIETEKGEVQEDINLVMEEAAIKYYSEKLEHQKDSYSQELFSKTVRGKIKNLKISNSKITGLIIKNSGNQYKFTIDLNNKSIVVALVEGNDADEQNDAIIFANNNFIYRESGKICSYTAYSNDDLGGYEEYDSEKANEECLVEDVAEYKMNSGGFWAITNNGDLYVYGKTEIEGMCIPALEDKEFACITQTPGHDLYGKKVKEVSMVGAYRGYALDEDGKYYIWSNGDNSGLLADGSKNTPVKIKCVSDIEGNKLFGKKIVSVADYLMDDQGKVYGWNSCHPGNGGTIKTDTPICINEIEDSPFYNKKILKFQKNDGSYIAIDEDKKIWTWGSNSFAVLGNGTTSSNYTAICLTDVEDSPLYNKKIVDCGINSGAENQFNTSGFCYAIDEDGKLYTWGAAWLGNLGNGEIIENTGSYKYYKPICISEVEDSELNGRRVVKAGKCYAIDAEGRLYGWGWDASVQRNYGIRTYPICLSEKENSIKGKKITNVYFKTSSSSSNPYVVDNEGYTYEWFGWNFYATLNDDNKINDIRVVDTFNVQKGDVRGSFYCMEDKTTYYSGNIIDWSTKPE